jgi:hypothetical protein
MPKQFRFFRKKPVVIKAIQWFRNGDHPEDESVSAGYSAFLTEGKVVSPFISHAGGFSCSVCGDLYSNHGSIKTLEGVMTVCPGDWIVTGVNGERYPVKPDIFEKTYEKTES